MDVTQVAGLEPRLQWRVEMRGAGLVPWHPIVLGSQCAIMLQGVHRFGHMTFSVSPDELRAFAQFCIDIDGIIDAFSGTERDIKLAGVLQSLLQKLITECGQTSLGEEASALLGYMQSKGPRAHFALSSSDDSIDTLKLLNRFLLCKDRGFEMEKLIDLEYTLLYLRLAYCHPEDRRDMLMGLYEEYALLTKFDRGRYTEIEPSIDEILEGGEAAWKDVRSLGLQLVWLRYLSSPFRTWSA
jgi:hypothetical protein